MKEEAKLKWKKGEEGDVFEAQTCFYAVNKETGEKIDRMIHWQIKMDIPKQKEPQRDFCWVIEPSPLIPYEFISNLYFYDIEEAKEFCHIEYQNIVKRVSEQIKKSGLYGEQENQGPPFPEDN
jgi:hypothetical protein